MLRFIEVRLFVTDNQFGFRKGHSTDTCVYTFKQLLEYNMKHSTPTYVCFLDASKAFDRVNHWTLFKKLLGRGVSAAIVKLLVLWYTTQQYIVLWDGCMSASFSVSSGVRQVRGYTVTFTVFIVYGWPLSTVELFKLWYVN
jgi:hypothetical protein